MMSRAGHSGIDVSNTQDRPSALAGLSRSEWSAVAIGVTVASLPAVMPAMVGAMAAQPHIGAEGAGYLVSVNMGGIFAGTLVSALAQARISIKRIIIAGLLVMMLGNLVTIAVTAMPAMLAARLFSGLGEGFAAGACFSLMAKSARPASTFAFYTAGQGIVGAVGMGSLPWLVAAFDWRAFYVALTVIAVPALYLVRSAASRGVEGAVSALTSRISAQGWVGLLLIFLFFTGMALVWAFLQPIGEQQGLSLATVSGALAGAALAGFAGSLAVAMGGHRLSDRTAWVIGMLLVVSAAGGLWMQSPFLFIFGVWALNFAWGFQYPFLFRALARTDPGRGAAVTPMATGIALTVGPALGGRILEHAGLETACLTFLVLTLGALAAALLRGMTIEANLPENDNG